MLLKQILLLAAAAISMPGYAQDKIYKRNGEVMEAKVKELSYIDITYKRADNPNGPDYVISKREVVRIEYENGVKERVTYGRRRPGSVDLDRKLAADHSHDNILSVAPVAISQSGTGVGLAYEHLLGKKGRIGLYLPVSLYLLGYDDSDSDISGPGGYLFAIGRDRRILQLAPGVKFYPTGSRGKVRYAVGAQLLYASGFITEKPFRTYAPYKNLEVLKVGGMINNSLNLSSGKHLYLGADLGLGITFINTQADYTTREIVRQKGNGLAQFSFRLGYRF